MTKKNEKNKVMLCARGNKFDFPLRSSIKDLKK